jgi:hypothetical protein
MKGCFNMKKMLSFFIVGLMSIFNASTIEKYTPTGHEQFSKLEFVEDRCLLKDLDQEYIDSKLKDMKSKFWGTRTEYLYQYEDANYVGSVVFSRSNKSDQPYIFDYTLTEVEFNERSISVEGSISLKGTIKTKKVEGSGQIEVKTKYSESESYQKTEKSQMKITVFPNRKITLQVAGEAKISSGFSKYFVFWICTQKGAWETVDVVTSYFELVEEDV